jgi:hypothetical protein
MSDRKIYVTIGVSQPMIRAAVAGLVMFSCSTELASEAITMTTFYPAPSGIYNRMITTGDTVLGRDGGKVAVGMMDFAPQTAAPSLRADDVNGVPAPGRLYYDAESDQMYMSSKAAVRADQSSWYKPVGAPTALPVAIGLKTAQYTLPVSNGYKSVGGLTAGVTDPATSIVGGNLTTVRSPILKSGGLFLLQVTGRYCNPNALNPDLTAANDDAVPIKLRLYYRKYVTTGVGDWGQTAQVDGPEDEDLAFDANQGGVPCGDFELNSLVSVPSARVGIDLYMATLNKKNLTGTKYIHNVAVTARRLIMY